MEKLNDVVIQAVKENRIEILRNAHTPQLQALDARHQSLLFYAIKAKSYDALTFLLEVGLPVNATNSFKESPLHVAAYLGDEIALKILLEYEADVRCLNDKQQSALMLSAAKGEKEAFHLLLDQPQRLQTKDEQGQNAAFYAVKGRKRTILKALKHAGLSLFTFNHKRQTLLHEAALVGDTRLFRYLLEEGLNPFISDIYKQTPLHVAVLHQHVEIVEICSDKGVSSYAADHFNLSPYHAAEQYGFQEIITVFERQKNTPEARFQKVEFPLHDAARHQRLDEVFAQISRLDKDVFDGYGGSVLFYALMHEDVALIDQLFKHSSSIASYHQAGYDFWLDAMRLQNIDLLETITRHLPWPDTLLESRIYDDLSNATKVFLERRKDH